MLVWGDDSLDSRGLPRFHLGIRSRSDQSHIPPSRTVECTACTYDAGLLHTDIKPDNAFLDAAGDVLLGDFGLACFPEPTTGHGHHFGTAETMAPEVAAAFLGLPGGQGSTVASDIYSLGATLRYLLTCMAAVASTPPSPCPTSRPTSPRGSCNASTGPWPGTPP